jgi:hypothetical protein
MSNNKIEKHQINFQTNSHPLYVDFSVDETEDTLTMSENRDAVYRGER